LRLTVELQVRRKVDESLTGVTAWEEPEVRGGADTGRLV
jgi:hypothetical protein